MTTSSLENPSAHTHAAVSPLIAVSHLFKSVQDATGTLDILRDIDFTLAPQQSLAIVGASGSGKSTLLAIMAGLDTPSQGSVWLGGVDIFSLNEDERAALRARQVGFVFQSFQLLGNMTALENVMLPLELAGLPNPRAAAKDMLVRVGLGERLNHYPKVLSGGEQQRVALARAFVVKPALLLADEPTGSLDSKSADAVFDLLHRVSRDQGTTVLFVTHNPELAGRCEKTIQVVDGRVVG